MQKVIIKNLGPIKECNIELRNFMVFIGNSGNGNSSDPYGFNTNRTEKNK